MEEALGADGHGLLEQHDALIGLGAVMSRCFLLLWGGMRINANPMSINGRKGTLTTS
jgi:hypothetical protein